MKTLKFLTVVTIMMAMMTALGCSGGPSTTEMESQIKESEKSPIGDVAAVHVTDKREVKEVKGAYEAKYEYELKFTKNFADLKKEVSHMNPMSGDFITASMMLGDFRNKYGEFKTGETKKLKGSCGFEKWDKGWKIMHF